jgi:hypothetical protein
MKAKWAVEYLKDLITMLRVPPEIQGKGFDSLSGRTVVS